MAVSCAIFFEDFPNYEKLAEEAVKSNGLALMYIDHDIENYDQLAKTAVQYNGMALRYIKKHNNKSY